MYTIKITFSPYFQEMNFVMEMSLEQSTTKNIDSVYLVKKKRKRPSCITTTVVEPHPLSSTSTKLSKGSTCNKNLKLSTPHIFKLEGTTQSKDKIGETHFRRLC